MVTGWEYIKEQEEDNPIDTIEKWQGDLAIGKDDGLIYHICPELVDPKGIIWDAGILKYDITGHRIVCTNCDRKVPDNLVMSVKLSMFKSGQTLLPEWSNAPK